MMNRTITVKGIGKASAKPDLIILHMTLRVIDPVYEQSMEHMASSMNHLQRAVGQAGFAKEQLKTTSFEIDVEYENERDSLGNYTRVFKGYSCTHGLKLEFDLDITRLAGLFGHLAACTAKPEYSIAFAVKDRSTIGSDVLKTAVKDASTKAAILAEASGARLGQLLSIDYSWTELRFESDTRLGDQHLVCCDTMMPMVDIEPEDVRVKDTVTFVWELV